MKRMERPVGRVQAVAVALAVAVAGGAARGGDVGLTIYNARFACVKEARELELREGENRLRLTDMAGGLEADSVVLRETGGEPFGVEVLEQRFVNEPLTEEILLRELEGRKVRFRTEGRDGGTEEESGEVVRGGHGRDLEPIVGTESGVRFSLPGQPVFDGLDADAYLKPSLEWVLRSGKTGRCPVEVSYLTGGLSWEAAYNLVAEGTGGEYKVSGWVGIRNDSGKDYPAAAVKLLAGDVHKVERLPPGMVWDDLDFELCEEAEEALPQERRFDEFHLYTLPRRTTLKNGELKQVEFLRAEGVRGEREYVYEPLRGWEAPGLRAAIRPEEGQSGEWKVAVFVDVSNSKTNGLGVPLPKGTVRSYRRDAKDGRLEFTGENAIGHTPKDEVLRLSNGYAFDLAAERKQTGFSADAGTGTLSESFEIKVRNHKDAAVDIRLVEHLWRWAGWVIAEESAPHEKTASDRAEWVVNVPPGGETVVAYRVVYRLK